jgi:hypothetical protein
MEATTHLGIGNPRPRGEKDARGGTRWLGIRGQLPNALKDVYFPNFELGIAGVAYGLARLYAETRDTRFLDAAKQGALHLQKIAKVDGDTALVHYREPDKTFGAREKLPRFAREK